MEEQARSRVQKAARVVVKVGTHTLASRRGKPNEKRMAAIVDGIAALRRQGKEVVLVSSGAVGMGLDALKIKSRPKRLADLQMAASVGQTRLMSRYQQLFSRKRIQVGQVLLTNDDLHHRTRHLNARTTLYNLLHNGVLPIINENDAISVEEIKVGDNDMLAAQVSLLLDADLLVLLTTVNGLRRYQGNRSTRVSYLPTVDAAARSLAQPTSGAQSTGGMASKLSAAEQVVRAGAQVVIADGRRSDTLQRLFSGEDVGTVLGSPAASPRAAGRKRWLAFFPRAQGTLAVDAGAAKAIRERGRSLLPVGVVGIDGTFDAGAVVVVHDEHGHAIARGLVSYSSSEIEKIKGCRTADIEERLGARQFDEVIHRDNMAVL